MIVPGAIKRVGAYKGAQFLGLTFILTLSVLGFWAGWRLFEFSTDDAFIAFRYVANGVRGWGLVYNPPPFQPVEGYTSFLWVTLLRGVWELFGVEAPQAARVLNPLFGLGWLALTAALVVRMRLWARLGGWWLVVLALVLASVLANRTFLAWLSSGLETSLFCFLFTWWVYEATAQPRVERRGWWGARLSTGAALLALTRPDGILAVAGTCFILVHCSRHTRTPRLHKLLAAAPLLLVPAHLVWRRLTYNDWLPNTYYAKHLGAWPEAGMRYLASFVVEYGVYAWAVLALIWWIRRVRSPDAWPFWRHGGRGIGGAVAVAVLLAHTGYYTFIIGGDHFEYRVYAHLIPLLFVSAAGMAARLGGPALVTGVLAGLLLLSLPIPWIHWRQTQQFTNRTETQYLVSPVAPSFPSLLRPLIRRWDGWQNWLIRHSVCNRHQEHKVFHIFLLDDQPRGKARMSPRWDHKLITSYGNIGVAGWRNLNTVVIDELGLTDRVIARRPRKLGPSERVMAHDRKPPPGYLRCFRIGPVMGGEPRFPRPDEVPLTDEEIRRCESRRWY